MAKVRPAWAMTLVLGEKSISSKTGPGRGLSPGASATAPERTQRLRYQRARPSSSRIPWTIPSPVNQW